MFLFGVIWTLGVRIRKALEYFKNCLMGHPSRSMEDSGAECELVNCGDQVSEEKNVSMWHRDWFCYILVKKVAAF